jgi:diguanylate cyclase (GGDEF)-like protein
MTTMLNNEAGRQAAGRARAWRFDYFIHPRLREHADTLHRVRLLVAALIIFSLLLTAVATFIFLTFEAHISALIGISIDVVLVVVNIIMLGVIRRTGNYRICAAIEIMMIFTGIVVGIWVSAGIVASPVTQLLILGPLLGYVFGGTRWGNSMVVLTLLVVAMFAALHFRGYPFIQSIAPSNIGLSRIMITMLNLAVVAAMALVYERTTANLQRERDAEHQRYMRLAKIDPLTGLENRRNFDAEVNRRIELALAQDKLPHFTLCFIDLDGFKAVNDLHGHNIGDEVLRVVSDRLRSASRAIDVVGRHGGDEFMLMLDAVSDRITLDTMARRLIDSIEQPISTSVGMIGVGASIGFAQFPGDTTDLDALKKAADMAMYEAKRERKGWVFFEARMGRARQ